MDSYVVSEIMHSLSWWTVHGHTQVWFWRRCATREIISSSRQYIYHSLAIPVLAVRNRRSDLCCWCHLTDIPTYVLQHYGWRRAALWSTQTSNALSWVCGEFGNVIEDIFSRSDNVTLTERIHHAHWGDMPIDTIDFALHRIRQRARSEYVNFWTNTMIEGKLRTEANK